MNKFELYKVLKSKGFPQGGAGDFLQDPHTGETVYIPVYQELITTFVGDPKDWEHMRDAMALVWIGHKK